MADNGKTARSGGRESLRKVSISRIKKEMSDVFYLSDDLVISALTADKNTTADYPTSIDGFTAIIMMTGEATVSIDMQNYSIKPNTIVFFNPDSIIRTIKCSSNAAAYLLAFSKSFVNEIQIDLSTSLPVYMRFGKAPVLEVTPQDVDQIRQLFQLIKTMLRSDKERYRHEIIRTLFTTARSSRVAAKCSSTNSCRCCNSTTNANATSASTPSSSISRRNISRPWSRR